MSLMAREFYNGSNGDRWFVLRKSESGTILINHRPNAASGGRPSLSRLENSYSERRIILNIVRFCV